MLFFLLVAWSVEVVDLLLMGGSLDAWGIAPRNVVGMRGIVASPFLHGGIPHLHKTEGIRRRKRLMTILLLLLVLVLLLLLLLQFA